jgi:hypothetical protein
VPAAQTDGVSVAEAEVAGINMAPRAPATTTEPRLSFRDFFTGKLLYVWGGAGVVRVVEVSLDQPTQGYWT